jgi:RNA polymerase sigma-70 factor (ECF subfamily)
LLAPAIHANEKHEREFWFPELCEYVFASILIVIPAGWAVFRMMCGTAGFPGTFVATPTSYEGDSDRGGADFHRLVELHYAPLFRFAMSLTLAESDAGDLVQDTFLAWATKGHQLQERAKVKAWLFTTLHRRFLESRRRITRFPHVEIEAADAELPAVEPDLVRRLDAHDALELLRQVDEPYQAAVAFSYLEDYSYPEIAAILEVPPGTVKSRIARGVAQLRQLVLRRASQAGGPAKGSS